MVSGCLAQKVAYKGILRQGYIMTPTRSGTKFQFNFRIEENSREIISGSKVNEPYSEKKIHLATDDGESSGGSGKKFKENENEKF